jgi:alpha-beta hydrolase superfamily lysophospholipase
MLAGLIFLWMVAGSITSPKRRELQGYHENYLDGASGHGLLVTKHSLTKIGVPCLLVRPDPVAGMAKRGEILRDQLDDAGQLLPAFGEEKGLIVLLHGRNGRKEDLLPVAERFCAVGFVCVIPDLPAHGESSVRSVRFGVSFFEQVLPGKVVDETRELLGLKDLPQFLWGMSMGGSIAIHAAAHEPERWERAIIVSSFDRLDGVVEDSLGWAAEYLIPVASQLIVMRGGPEIEKVRPVELAKKLSLPTLVIHGDSDELIAYERGRALYEGFAGEKEFLTVPGGDHDNVLITEAPVYAAMAKWFLNGL